MRARNSTRELNQKIEVVMCFGLSTYIYRNSNSTSDAKTFYTQKRYSNTWTVNSPPTNTDSSTLTLFFNFPFYFPVKLCTYTRTQTLW